MLKICSIFVKMKQEIEKRFVLKEIPHIDKKDMLETLDIEQYYYFENGIWKRLRHIQSNDGYYISYYYLHTVKHYKDGKTFEEEEVMELSKGKELLNKIKEGKFESKFLTKKRTVVDTYKDELFQGYELKRLKWEIDEILSPEGFKIIIAEMEIPAEEYEINTFLIKNEILKEVTNDKKFSNFSLASSMNF